jgi:hypothetical protein
MEHQLKPGNKILIVKPKITRSCYELTLDEKVIGSFLFPKTFGTLADVTLFGEEWSLKRMGFWKPYITVRRKTSDQDYLQVPFSGKWQGLLSLTMPDGRSYELGQTGFWNPKWVWTKYNVALMEFDLKSGLKKYAEVTIREQDQLLNLLLVIGVYGLIMQGWDEAASAGAATAAIG